MHPTCTLKDFVGFLKCTCDYTIEPGRTTFGERIKLQKYVFIATHMGLSTAVPLDYSMYIRGPYSSMLADIYFNEHAWDTPLFDLKGFDAKLFSSLLAGKDTAWLEISATIIYVAKVSIASCRPPLTREALVGRIQMLKPFGEAEISRVYEELCSRELVQHPLVQEQASQQVEL